MIDIELYICFNNELIVDAMKKINKNSRGILYVVDDNNSLTGCLTDGDIRRWITSDGRIDVSVREVMSPKPVYVMREHYDEALEVMHRQQIISVPVVDEKLHIIDILFAESKAEKKKTKDALKSTPVIIMAGGRGTRLYPYTKILPKPLVPVGNVPIVERIMNRFAVYGVQDFFLTINYRKQIIKSYFSEVQTNYRIHFVEEEQPLGTAGSIRLIEESFHMPVIITNCDILIEADYEDVMKYHMTSGNDVTIVSARGDIVIPYGVLQAKENGIITSMQEKPEFSYFINTGMYFLNPEFIDWIPQGKLFHMTELVDDMIKAGRQVGMYPINQDAFLDMGGFAEMKRMEERINAGFVEE